jgi:hypothetical protein
MQPIYARIYKVDEATRTVTGRAAQEVVDRDNEMFDYQSSKPEFMKWSAECSADTNGKSLGNVRSMHGNIAAGKLTNIEFLDEERAIDVSAKIVDNNEWEKVLEGVHTGFSIGGRYAKKWAEPIGGKMITRYTAVPSEISIVDRPCIPTAKFFSIHKRDGSVVRKAFAVQPVVEFVGGKVQMIKGGPGSGPHGGSHKDEIKSHFTNKTVTEGGTRNVKGATVRELKDAMRGKVPQNQSKFVDHIRQHGLTMTYSTKENAYVVHEPEGKKFAKFELTDSGELKLLENGGPGSGPHGGLGARAKELTAKASKASERAEFATEHSVGGMYAHELASKAHDRAATAHEKAAFQASLRGSRNSQASHEAQASYHSDKAQEHYDQAGLS